MTRKPVLLKREDWATEANRWLGRVEGKDIGTTVTILFFSSDTIGGGPPLHVHSYDEVFIVRQGRARFTIGDDIFDAEAGQILLGPANIPHKFENLGPGRLETTDFHLSDRFEQIELEEDT